MACCAIARPKRAPMRMGNILYADEGMLEMKRARKQVRQSASFRGMTGLPTASYRRDDESCARSRHA